MKEIGVFDVIGPVMVGPSSSHTAGALRIARMAGRLCQGGAREAVFELYGSFAKTYRGHGTDRALVGGMLGFDTDDIRIRDSFAYARGAGLSFRFEPMEGEAPEHPNTVNIIMKNARGDETRVMGSSVGGGSVRISQIDGVRVDFTGEYNTVLIKQQDAPGVAAFITGCFSEYGMNIAFMRIYRDGRGELAYTIVEADEPYAPELIEKLRGGRHILSVLPVSM